MVETFHFVFAFCFARDPPRSSYTVTVLVARGLAKGNVEGSKTHLRREQQTNTYGEKGLYGNVNTTLFPPSHIPLVPRLPKPPSVPPSLFTFWNSHRTCITVERACIPVERACIHIRFCSSIRKARKPQPPRFISLHSSFIVVSVELAQSYPRQAP